MRSCACPTCTLNCPRQVSHLTLARGDDLFAVPDALALASTLMTRIKEILTLAKLCYAQANDTLNPEAKKTLQDIGNQYAQKAEELRRIEITRAVFPATKK